VLAKLKLTALYELNKKSGLRELGWFRSFYEAKPIDANGDPIPWFTYSAIYFLKKKLTSRFSRLNVFEYGSGYSSLWWAEQVESIDSVEHDRAWFEKMNEIKKSNFKMHYRDIKDESYVLLSKELNKKYDIVVVDGRRRNECIVAASESVTEEGIIILDNSDRERYLTGINFLQNLGYSRIEFSGMTPMGVALSETSIFFRRNNILEL
jgi:hypothetical protein